MTAVFFGTPDFAVVTLDALVASRHAVLAVVTQPDRPRGRGLAAAPSPVKARAIALGLPVHEPERLRGSFTESIRKLAPDVLVVVAYGRILPPELLAVAPRGAVNVHASLLPRHRGASPINAAILAGDAETGVTTMLMDAGLDTGPMLLRAVVAVAADEDALALSGRLARRGAALLVDTLDAIAAGDLMPEPQDEGRATYAAKLSVADAWIDWTLAAEVVARRVRGLLPWPVARTRLPDGRLLRLLRVKSVDFSVGAAAGDPPGTVRLIGRDRIEVACGHGRILLEQAQPEGKRVLAAAELRNGRVLGEGDRLGT